MKHLHQRHDHRFFVGLMTGTFVGAGLATWLIPRVAVELRKRGADPTGLASALSYESYQPMSSPAGAATQGTVAQGTVEGVTKKHPGRRDGMTDRVAQRQRKAAPKPKAIKHPQS